MVWHYGCQAQSEPGWVPDMQYRTVRQHTTVHCADLVVWLLQHLVCCLFAATAATAASRLHCLCKQDGGLVLLSCLPASYSSVLNRRPVVDFVGLLQSQSVHCGVHAAQRVCVSMVCLGTPAAVLQYWSCKSGKSLNAVARF